MSNIITAKDFLGGYIKEFQKNNELAWPRDAEKEKPWKRRTKFATKAACTVIENANLGSDFPIDPQQGKLKPGDRLIPSKEYFRVDVIGEEKVGDHDCNWILRVAFEHENRHGLYKVPQEALCWSAPQYRPHWIQELCKLTHLYANLRVLAAYHEDKKGDETLVNLLQKNINRMQRDEDRMTRVRGGEWLFIFGVRAPAGDSKFRAFTLGGHDHITVTELEMPS